MRADMYETADLGYAAKRQNFTGEHKDWPLTAYMGCANPKSTEALSQAAAGRTQDVEDHNPQLYFALALLCKGSAPPL